MIVILNDSLYTFQLHEIFDKEPVVFLKPAKKIG